MTKLVSLKIDPEIKASDSESSFLSPDFIYIECDNSKVVGDYVYKDEILGVTSSSISGYITKILSKNINNRSTICYEITNDFKEERQKSIHLNKEIANLTKETLVTLLKKHNMNSYIKKIEDEKKVLVINAIDDEPYVYNELFYLKKFTNELLEVIDIFIKTLNLNKAIIVTKSINESSIKSVLSSIGIYPNISIVLTPNKYLISYKPFLCKFLSEDQSETTFYKASELFEIYECIKKNKKAITNYLTITDEENKTSYMVLIKNNMLLKEIFKELNINTTNDVYANGLMSGFKIFNLDNFILTSNIKSILITKKKDKKSDCINCGACNRMCPVNINVKKNYDKKSVSSRCLNCGLCNYVCPVNIDIKDVIWGDRND